jgi:hypothetical protein
MQEIALAIERTREVISTYLNDQIKRARIYFEMGMLLKQLGASSG